MPRISSSDNPRLKEAARLIASSRERRKSGRCVLEGEHLVDVYCRALRRARIADRRRVRRRMADGACAARARPAGAHADRRRVGVGGARATAGRGRRARGRRRAGAGRRARRGFLPAARRRAGSGQRRLDAAQCRGGRRRAGVHVAALRVRLVAQGAARRAGRALSSGDIRRTSISVGWARAYRGKVVAMVAAGGERRCSTPTSPDRSRSRSATKARDCRTTLRRRRATARHDSDAGRIRIAQRRGGRGDLPVRVRQAAIAPRVTAVRTRRPALDRRQKNRREGRVLAAAAADVRRGEAAFDAEVGRLDLGSPSRSSTARPSTGSWRSESDRAGPAAGRCPTSVQRQAAVV